MSGRYNSLQGKVAAEIHHVVWIPCAGHSHLVGQAAAECCQAAVVFITSLKQSMFFSQFRHIVMKFLQTH